VLASILPDTGEVGDVLGKASGAFRDFQVSVRDAMGEFGPVVKTGLLVIIKGLGSFTGTDRRFQYKGEVAGVTIVDDYAHHPTEIEATLHAAHNYPHKKLWCVFQPHTYTRTKALLPEFAKALSLADHVVLADIYAARETDTLGISSQTLQAEIEKLGKPCYYFPTFEEIEKFLKKSAPLGCFFLITFSQVFYRQLQFPVSVPLIHAHSKNQINFITRPKSFFPVSRVFICIAETKRDCFSDYM
jgi:hypothetical protein